jgi:hypothetical protein
MSRLLTTFAALSLLAFVFAATAADKPDGKADVTGSIKSYKEDAKLLVVETKSAGKKGGASETTEVKVGDNTKIEYVGIEGKDYQQLLLGYNVVITLDSNDKDTASVIKVSRSTETPKKKK